MFNYVDALVSCVLYAHFFELDYSRVNTCLSQLYKFNR